MFNVITLVLDIFRSQYFSFDFNNQWFDGGKLRWKSSSWCRCSHTDCDAGKRLYKLGNLLTQCIYKKKFFWVILFGSTEDSVVYQFIYSGFVSPVSQNNQNGLSPKESKVALSSPEASSHYQMHQPSVASIPAHHQEQPPLSTAATPSNKIQQSPMMHMPQQQQPQPQSMTVVALHPCKI